jgi:hypothetical protein
MEGIAALMIRVSRAARNRARRVAAISSNRRLGVNGSGGIGSPLGQGENKN